MYVNIGSRTNSCQVEDRRKDSPGANPCTELDTRAGIWKFDARKKNQTQATAVHFARGIRNAVGIAINPADGKLWTTQHGRDQLGGDRQRLVRSTRKYNAENPAEELMQVNQGDDFGWPYCYYSVEAKKLVLAPEYGGDGKKVGRMRAEERDQSPRSPGTGRRTRCSSTRARSCPRDTRMARSSRSTARGIARRSRRLDSTSSSSR